MLVKYIITVTLATIVEHLIDTSHGLQISITFERIQPILQMARFVFYYL